MGYISGYSNSLHVTYNVLFIFNLGDIKPYNPGVQLMLDLQGYVL